MTDEKGLYARASKRVEQELWKFQGQEFTREQMHKECGCRPFDTEQVSHKEFRDAVTRVLYEWSDANKERVKPILRQVGRNGYRVIERIPQTLDWSGSGESYGLIFPKDADTGLELPFANNIIISGGDVIGIAGESNTAKSALAWNFAAENMDTHDVHMWLSEFHPAQTRRRMAWSPIFDENGLPRIATHPLDNPWDIADRMAEYPDGVHLLDWVNLGDRFWDIGKILEKIQNVIAGKGVAVVFTQKSRAKDEGVGGHFGKDNTSLYMTLSELSSYYKRLKILKVKEPNGRNPETKSYRFAVVNNGGQLSDVAEIKDCGRCHGKGTVWNKAEGEAPCPKCDGAGYTVLGEDL